MTIRTVAERAGVSTATVSRALSGNRLVTPALQSAVRAAAKELGYTSNAVAVALRSARTNTVGMVVPDITAPGIASLIAEVEDELQASGNQLLLRSAQHDVERENDVLRSLVNRQVDGVIIWPVDTVNSRDAVESASRFVPVVQVGKQINGFDGDWIGTNEIMAVEKIVGHLASTGAASAAYIGPKISDPSASARLRTFRCQAAAAGIEIDRKNILLGPETADFGKQSMIRLLSTQLPDAVVCTSDVIAACVLQVCKANNVPVPADLVIIGNGDAAFARLCTPQLTTVQQPFNAIAKHAVQTLRAAQNDSERRSIQLSLQPALIVRESSRGQT